MGRESSEQRDNRARIAGYVFGYGEDQDKGGSSEGVAGVAAETVQAFARRCLAESRKIA